MPRTLTMPLCAAALGAPPAPAAPPQTDAEGKDESLDSLMARLGGAIRGHAVGVRNTQEGAATQQRRLPRRGSQQGQPSPVVREVFRLHRDERRSPAELAAAFSLDAATLERALRAAALPRIREVQVGVPPTARRIAGE